jgi:hypothetical protein
MDLNLPPNLKHFETMLANQSQYRDMYMAQQKDIKDKRNKDAYDKKYYGNSPEYQKLWYKTGAQGFNK